MPDDYDQDDDFNDDHSHDDAEVISHDGVYTYHDHQEPARLYHGANEPCPPFSGVILDDDYERWTDPDGVKSFRRVEGRAASVGASKTYSSNYDSIDWGN